MNGQLIRVGSEGSRRTIFRGLLSHPVSMAATIIVAANPVRFHQSHEMGVTCQSNTFKPTPARIPILVSLGPAQLVSMPRRKAARIGP